MSKDKICNIVKEGMEQFVDATDKVCLDAKNPKICAASRLIKDPYFTRFTKIYKNLRCRD